MRTYHIEFDYGNGWNRVFACWEYLSTLQADEAEAEAEPEPAKSEPKATPAKSASK